MRPTSLGLAIMLALSASLAAAQQSGVTRLDGSSITSSEIDSSVAPLMKAAEVTGVGIGIFNNGKIAYLKAYGVRDKEKNLLLTVDSVMSAASFSKVAFAFLAMELVDEGVLDLDRPVYQYLPKQLPEYPKYADLCMVWQVRFEDDHANGYDEYGRSLDAQRREKADAAGSMLTTIADFARFTQAVMQGRLLQAKTRELMLSPQLQTTSKHLFPTFGKEVTDENKAIRLSYGLAWGLHWTPYGKAFFKEGHDEGWRNYAVCFDKPKTGVVIMTNSSNGEGIFKELLEVLLKNTYTPIEWEGYTPYDKLPPRPPLKQHKQVAVDHKVLDRYVGRYGLPPDIILVIRREGDHLSVQENDEPKRELLPESETDFFSATSNDSYTFQTDNQNKVTMIILHADGKDIPIKRIE